MKCPYCSDAIPDDSAFCPECGKKVKKIAVPKVPVPSVPDATFEEKPLARQAFSKREASGSRDSPVRSKAVTANPQKPLSTSTSAQKKKTGSGKSRVSTATPATKRGKSKSIQTEQEGQSHAGTALLVLILSALNYWFYPDEAPTGGGVVFSVILLVAFLFRGKSTAPFSILLTLLLLWIMILAGGLIFFALLEYYDLDEYGLLPGAAIAFLELLLLLSLYRQRPSARK